MPVLFQVANSIVIGPGLGREQNSGEIVEAFVASVIEKLQKQEQGRKANIIMDADSLWFLKESQEMRVKLKDIAMR